jgi:hypothetical protein
MTIAETMAAIERDEFAAEMNLAAGTNAFRRAIREHDLFRRLSELTKENTSAVLERIETISLIEIDDRYENPFDTALSAYLMALPSTAEPQAAARASQAVLRTQKIWWASAVARELLLQTVAGGAFGGGADLRESVNVRSTPWNSSLGHDTTTRELLRAVSSGQPTGIGSQAIQFRPQETPTGHSHMSPKAYLKRRKGSARVHNIAGARKRA